MRGKMDLGNHKLAGLFRGPAERNRWKRPRREKTPDEAYRMLWQLVSGAVRDSFANHPEYLTDAGRRAAERSIVKRVTGTLHGYATQVARGRSMQAMNPLPDVAADKAHACVAPHDRTNERYQVRWWARLVQGCAWGREGKSVPEIHGDDDA